MISIDRRLKLYMLSLSNLKEPREHSLVCHNLIKQGINTILNRIRLVKMGIKSQQLGLEDI